MPQINSTPKGKFMDKTSVDPGWYSTVLTALALFVGWLIGIAKTTWWLSKHKSSVDTLQDRVKVMESTLEANHILDRLQLLEGIAKKIENMPDVISTMSKTVSSMDKIIFQERGGLNILTLQDHKNEQERCQRMFARDIEQIKFMVGQIVESSGVKTVQRIEATLNRIEDAMLAKENEKR